MIRVCHFSSVHKAYDTRILLKECSSLVGAGYEVFLIAQNQQSEKIRGVNILALNRKSSGRLSRALFFTWRVFFAALKTKSKIYHFHDPELIPAGLVLRLLGKRVIFDVHENIARQIKVKSYLPFPLLISKLYTIVDWISAKAFYLVLAENSYKAVYDKYGAKSQIVLNMPDLDFLKAYRKIDRPKSTRIELFYVGGITFERGIETLIKALLSLKNKGVDVFFHCVGPYEDSTMQRIHAIEGFDEVKDSLEFYGPERLDLALERSTKCHIGLSVLLPIENYLESYSTKIFEYMSIGLPVITSNFPLYQNVVDRYKCGYCIDPYNHDELAHRIEEIGRDDDLRMEMSKNGVKAAEDKFNWSKEEEKLLKAYEYVLKK